MGELKEFLDSLPTLWESDDPELTELYRFLKTH
jgi:hypothetical protein